MLNKFQAFTIIKLLILILVITGWPGLASLLPVSSFLLLREWVISWVLFCGNKDLKWQTNVTAHLQLRVLFSKQRIVYPGGMRVGRSQRRGLNPSWVSLFVLFVSSLQPALYKLGLALIDQEQGMFVSPEVSPLFPFHALGCISFKEIDTHKKSIT